MKNSNKVGRDVAPRTATSGLRRSTGALSLGVTMALAPVPAALAGDVFLDFSDFGTRLGELATSAGVTAFSGAEQASIEAGIKSKLETAYSGFTGLSFVTADPGGVEDIVFGLTAGGGGLGVADHIDFLNRDQADTARVFSANFDFILDEFTGSTARATQLAQLTTALAGTAAHELGHNLGLRHHDAYGDQTYTGNGAGGGGPIATGGAQNDHVMATGSTGLGETGRETDRDFSVHSLAKLAYADGTLPVNPTAALEGVDAGGTIGTATAISFEAIPVANRFGEVVIGELGVVGDTDVYAVSLVGGSVFTADINVDFDSGTAFDNVNTRLELLDGVGTVLADDLVSSYSGNTYGSGGFGDGFDPAYFNVAIATTGTYYVRVTGEANNPVGDYNLLMHTDLAALVSASEPGSLAMLALGLAGLGAVARRRRRAPPAR